MDDTIQLEDSTEIKYCPVYVKHTVYTNIHKYTLPIMNKLFPAKKEIQGLNPG